MLEALANALVTAYKRMPEAAEEALVEIDVETGEIRVIAQELDEEGNVTREWDDTPADFGRIAAQTAKQVILQRIREAEREMKYEEYAGREGDIVTGIIQQTDARYTLLDLGRVEALLPQAEQVPGDRYDHGSRMKAYIVEVRKTAKGPQIVVSRTHPGLVRRLFELEVPELVDGVVEIQAVAREPGHRTKLAVASNDQNVDPVGACVGARGMRVRQVVNELRGEKVDIVPYSADAPEFVMRALAPAKVREVRHPRGHRHRRGHRPRLPALARDRQGRPERASRGPAHRLARRHQERDAARGGRIGRRLRRGRVGRRPRRRADVAAGRGRRGDQRGRGRVRHDRRRRGRRVSTAEPEVAPTDDGATQRPPTATDAGGRRDAAMHIDATADDAADELAADADLDDEDADVTSRGERSSSETAGERELTDPPAAHLRRLPARTEPDAAGSHRGRPRRSGADRPDGARAGAHGAARAPASSGRSSGERSTGRCAGQLTSTELEALRATLCRAERF